MQIVYLTCRIFAQAIIFASAFVKKSFYLCLDFPLHKLFLKGYIFSCVVIWKLLYPQQDSGECIITPSM